MQLPELTEAERAAGRLIIQYLQSIEVDIKALAGTAHVPPQYFKPPVFALRFARVAIADLINERKTQREPMLCAMTVDFGAQKETPDSEKSGG